MLKWSWELAKEETISAALSSILPSLSTPVKYTLISQRSRNRSGICLVIRLFGTTREDKLLSARIANSMRKNRKIFNLFKFIDEIYHIMKLAKDKSIGAHIRFFEIMAHCGSFSYFLLDNILWLINTKIISR